MRFLLTLARKSIYLILAIFTFVSCKKNQEEERVFNENRSIESVITTNKWKYTIVDDIYHVVRKPSYGYQASKGDTVEFWYVGYTLDGKVFDTNIDTIAKRAKLDASIRSFIPLKLIAGESNLIGGLNNGLLQIREREVATLLFPSTLGYGGNAIGSVRSWSPLAFDIMLIKVNNNSIQQEKSYISSLNLEGFIKDASGLFYKYEPVGVELITPSIKDTIYGWYKGTLSNGAVFDEVTTLNKQIILSTENIPEGVKLGFILTKKAGITELVLPSYLGFGNKGNRLVKPYETIHYRIRLDSIK